jgi:aspartyl-tRNA(Asn)/glutamyl-tRNA(Gln) amidotransferase subunit A
LLCPYTQEAMSHPLPTAAAYREARVRQRRLHQQFEKIFAGFDVIVSPTMHVLAPPVDDGWDSPYDDPWMGTPFTAVVNMLKLTAMSYPVGRLDGLPVGLQIVAPGGQDATVLEVGRLLETVRPWAARPD